MHFMDQSHSELKAKEEEFEKQLDLITSEKIQADQQIESINDENYVLQQDIKSKN